MRGSDLVLAALMGMLLTLLGCATLVAVVATIKYIFYGVS